MNYDPLNDAERLKKVHKNYQDLILYADAFLPGIVSEFERGLIKNGMSEAQKISFRTIFEIRLEDFYCSKLTEKDKDNYPFNSEGKYIGNQKFTIQNLLDYVKQQRELRKDIEQRLPEMKRQYKERQNAKEQFYLGEPLTPPESQPAASNEAPPESETTAKSRKYHGKETKLPGHSKKKYALVLWYENNGNGCYSDWAYYREDYSYWAQESNRTTYSPRSKVIEMHEWAIEHITNKAGTEKAKLALKDLYSKKKQFYTKA